MTQYIVSLIAHIVEDKRPEGFPKSVTNDCVMECETLPELRQMVNNHLLKFIGAQSFFCLRNPADIQIAEDTEENFDRRIMVPFHMISHIESKTIRVTGLIQDAELKVPN